MALGGGTFLTMNKALAGTYINFVSAITANVAEVQRGVVAMPLELDWGPEATVFKVGQADFYQNAWTYFGHAYDDEAMLNLREIFRNASEGYFYRLGTGGVKATCIFADAKYPGTAGNRLKIVVAANEVSTEDDPLFDVTTYADNIAVDAQTVVNMAGLADNSYVVWKRTATLAVNAGVNLTGGTNGTVADANYQSFLDAIQVYSFNVLGCLSTDTTIKALFAAYTKRMRDQMGVKFQTVLHDYAGANYEGIISVANNSTAALVPWVVGAQAGCPINKALTNKTYDGEVTVDINYTQTQLETAVRDGKFIFHRVGDEVRVLQDINTLVTFSVEKSDIFADNQAIRVIDWFGNSVAFLFNGKYLGKIANDNAGRVSLWNDIVDICNGLQSNGAIANFVSSDVSVEAGEARDSVVVTVSLQISGTMSKLYMTVLIS